MNDLSDISKLIFEGNHRGNFQLTIDDFQKLYRIVARLCEENNKSIGETHIVLLTNDAIIKFEISPKVTITVRSNKHISTNDFEVVLYPRFEGNLKPITWGSFIWTEIRQNWWIFLFISIFEYVSFYRTNNVSGIASINQLLIDSSAIFISIFVLFTISQNRDLLLNKGLLKAGITHQLMQNDFYITSLAISSLMLAFASSSLLTLPQNTKLIIPIINTSFQIEFLTILLSHTATIFIFDCFLSVTRYYLKLMRRSIEAQMYRQLMGEKDDEKIP